MAFLEHDLGDGGALALRDLASAGAMHRLTAANLARLRHWEDWAFAELHEDATRAYTRIQLAAFGEGRSLPLAILQDGAYVGSLGARIDLQRETAELGYWIDEAFEGRGLVTRGVRAVVAHLAADRDIHRFEIRTAVHNTRSRAVAERAGFRLEGVLTGAFRIGPDRYDAALYGLVS
ncbi:MAG: GNAT family N-acetyltransferase [Amnibacterium sp.]